MASFKKDPDAVKDYPFDWAQWLPAGDIISAAQAIVDDPALTVDSVLHDQTTVTVWLSGGQPGKTYKVTCRITTAQGRKEDYSIYITVVEA